MLHLLLPLLRTTACCWDAPAERQSCRTIRTLLLVLLRLLVLW
jgi:hypothetical protein